MLELKNVSLVLRSDGRQIIDDFSFTLNRGDKAVVIGEEGDGKSTLLKFLYDPTLVDGYCDCAGKVTARGKTAYLPQSAGEGFLGRTLSECFSPADYYARVGMFTKLGLSADFILSDQKTETLSGGEKVKTRLALLLMEEPDILLLDEPTNDLDIETLEWLEDFIKNTKLPVLYVSHDETLIERTANVIVHMEQLIRKTKCRVTVTRAGYREYLSFRRSEFDHREQVAQNQRDRYDKQMEKWRQIYSRVDHEQRSITRQDPGGARLLKKKMKSVLSMGRRFEREKESFLDFPEEEEAILTKFDESIRIPPGKTVIDFSLDSLRVGDRVLARNLRLFLSGGAHVGITGRNGAGKSTLLSLLWEELRDRRDVTAACMPQNYAELLDYDKTPVEFLAERYTREDITRARTFMGSMKFTHGEMTGKIGELSGGQKAKILFLDMVLRGADVLLLDEPTRNFSPLSGPVVRDALRRFGGAIVSVSHDRKYLAEACDQVYELREEGLALLPAPV